VNRLKLNVIHIWHTKLECQIKRYKLFQSWLSAEEKIRAERLSIPYRRRFVISRGLLRDLLAYYSEQCPKNLKFTYTFSGKPLLISPQQPLEFNLSHSGNIIACAFAINTPIGIDIEHKTERKHLDKIAYRFLPKCEYDRLKLLRGKMKLNAFFNAWVRNEATLKAFGHPLQTHPNSQYQFSLNNITSQYRIKSEINSPCIISNLSLDPDFASAVAIRGNNKSIIIRKYIEKMSELNN
jgi:4'-phosphopantetheinyl transferase